MPQVSGDGMSTSELPSYLSGVLGYVMDDLVIGPKPPWARASLVPGSLGRGAVLGQVSVSGLYALSDPTASDGRQNPTAVLLRVATPAAGQFAMIATSGTFNANYLLWSANWSLQALSAALNGNGILAFRRGL